jgi:hypothetical protein
MPQLMTGRYYHQNILGPYLPNRHPREFPFSRPDSSAALLPDVLRRNGYQTLGASAHWWVVPGTPFGAGFDRLDFVPGDPRRGHADASDVIDRAIALWGARDRGRPSLLYVHLMDMHMPRFVPAEGLRWPVPGYDWHARFRPNGEPAFDRERRRWDRSDARDFTEADRRHLVALYDTRLALADAELGRLLARIREEDPDLHHTLVVVVADHGEELGEEGRLEHTDSLAEAVQHIPWIVAGAGVAPGGRVDGFTENVDVTPTLLALLSIPLPDGVRMDGRPQLGADGRPCPGCGKSAAYYAWETYRAIRTPRHLLRQELEGSLRARCVARTVLYRVTAGRRTPVANDSWSAHVERTLTRRLAQRLERRERAFHAARYGPPRASFLVDTEFWRVDDHAVLACVPMDAETPRARVRGPGWLWTGRGVAVVHGDGAPLGVTIEVPDGDYDVDVTAVALGREPWLFGFHRWLRKSFVPDTPTEFVPLGRVHAGDGRLSVVLPSAVGASRHVVALRLTPPGVAPSSAAPAMDVEQRTRLRALGYVQ